MQHIGYIHEDPPFFQNTHTPFPMPKEVPPQTTLEAPFIQAPMTACNAEECRINGAEMEHARTVNWPKEAKCRDGGGLHYTRDHNGDIQSRRGAFAVMASIGGSFRIFDVYPSVSAAEAAIRTACAVNGLFKKAYDLHVIDVQHAGFLPVPFPNLPQQHQRQIYNDERIGRYFNHELKCRHDEVAKVVKHHELI